MLSRDLGRTTEHVGGTDDRRGLDIDTSGLVCAMGGCAKEKAGRSAVRAAPGVKNGHRNVLNIPSKLEEFLLPW
jgi:hypothetical protein